MPDRMGCTPCPGSRVITLNVGPRCHTLDHAYGSLPEEDRTSINVDDSGVSQEKPKPTV